MERTLLWAGAGLRVTSTVALHAKDAKVSLASLSAKAETPTHDLVCASCLDLGFPRAPPQRVHTLQLPPLCSSLEPVALRGGAGEEELTAILQLHLGCEVGPHCWL